MFKSNLNNFMKNIGAKLGANAPGITIGLGTGAIIVSAVMVGVATPRAMELIEDAKKAKVKRLENARKKAPEDAVIDEDEELTVVEIIKAGWKPYMPAIMTAAVGIACIVGGTRVNARRNAALAHDRIVGLCMRYIDRGWITQDEYENLHDYLYIPYTDVADDIRSVNKLMKDVENLPVHKTEYKSKER